METMKTLFIPIMLIAASCAIIPAGIEQPDITVSEESTKESPYIEGTAMLKKLPPKTDFYSIYTNGPDYPHGKPDDISRFEGHYGPTSVTFTYYCYGGKYLVYIYEFSSFSIIYGVNKWILTNTYSSNGICDN